MMIMKNTLNSALLFSILLLGAACSNAGESYFGTYGAPITTTDATTLSAIDFEALEEKGGLLTLEGPIEATCKVKGCWMKVNDENGGSLRVTFKDYGFFVPKEGVEGKTAVFQGVLEKNEMSVEQLRHYAEDAGKSEEEIAAITEPVTEYSFVAEGVVIK